MDSTPRNAPPTRPDRSATATPITITSTMPRGGNVTNACVAPTTNAARARSGELVVDLECRAAFADRRGRSPCPASRLEAAHVGGEGGQEQDNRVRETVPDSLEPVEHVAPRASGWAALGRRRPRWGRTWSVRGVYPEVEEAARRATARRSANTAMPGPRLNDRGAGESSTAGVRSAAATGPRPAPVRPTPCRPVRSRAATGTSPRPRQQTSAPLRSGRTPCRCRPMVRR